MDGFKQKKSRRVLIDYDPKIFLQVAFVLGVPLVLGAVGLALSFAYLIVHCLKGGANEILESVVLATFLRFLNPALVEAGMVAAVGSMLVHMVGLMMILGKSKPGLFQRGSNIAWMVFIGYMLAVSLVLSRAPDVSVFKLVMLVLVVMLVILSVRGMDLKSLERFLFNVILFVVLASMPFFALPSIGMYRNGEGFQGILNHPQAAGVVLALFISYFGCLYIYAQERFVTKKWLMVVAVLAGFFLFKSQTRTAAFAVILAMMTTVGIVFFVQRFPRKRKKRLLKYAGLGVVFGVLLGVGAGGAIKSFIFKRQGDQVEDSSLEAVISSREGVVGNAMASFRDHPVFGTGFGISSPGTPMFVTYLPGTPIPISAPIEKGNLFVATLEEGGVIGLFLLFVLFGLLLKDRLAINPVYSVTLLIVLFINMGEYVLFTTNGLGPLLLLFTVLQPQKSSWGELK